MKSVSPLRYVGGKTRLLPILREYLPTTPKSYYEPFAGGAALFFAYGHQATGKAYLNDINYPLMNAYEMLRKNCENVFKLLDGNTGNELNHRTYEDVRFDFNQMKLKFGEYGIETSIKSPKFAALFIAINHLCFNGIYRENKKGEFNVPVGKDSKGHRRTLDTLDYEALRSAAGKLQGATITCKSFSPWPFEQKPGEGDVVFIDPPYLQEFSAYSKEGFTADDHKVLNAQAFAAASQGATVIVCGSNNAASREIYGEPTRVVTLQRTVGNFRDSKDKKRGKAEEALWVFNPVKSI